MNYIIFDYSIKEDRRNIPTNISRYGGCVYAVEYKNGITKVGITTNPKNRFISIQGTRTYADGGKIKRILLSKPFTTYRDVEKKILKHYKRLRITSTELVRVDFEKVCDYLQNILQNPKLKYFEFGNGIGNLTLYQECLIRSFLR